VTEECLGGFKGRARLAGIELNFMRRRWQARGELPTVSLDELEGRGSELQDHTLEPPSPSENFQLQMLWTKVEAATILMGNNKYVSAALLHYIDGRSTTEIAEALGLGGAASARVYVQRGLKILKNAVED
jgi:DNA-directed RNA polymerase specialized sigma24 family protein